MLVTKTSRPIYIIPYLKLTFFTSYKELWMIFIFCYLQGDRYRPSVWSAKVVTLLVTQTSIILTDGSARHFPIDLEESYRLPLLRQ